VHLCVCVNGYGFYRYRYTLLHEQALVRLCICVREWSYMHVCQKSVCVCGHLSVQTAHIYIYIRSVWDLLLGLVKGLRGGVSKMNSNRLNNQVSPLLRKAKLKVAPLELPFVINCPSVHMSLPIFRHTQFILVDSIPVVSPQSPYETLDKFGKSPGFPRSFFKKPIISPLYPYHIPIVSSTPIMIS